MGRSWIMLVLIILMGCKQHTRPGISFYYWKTSFTINAVERRALTYNKVKTLYVHYCDVVYSEKRHEAYPIATISFDSTVYDYDIVPVVFIENACFENLDAKGVKTLAHDIQLELDFMNGLAEIPVREIQFDCDWTERTKSMYFLFLKEFQALSSSAISCTIRLHQIKYPERTGIPPVDYGTLMYYNMGTISAGLENSIYEKSIADKYNSFIKNYPLTLDVALPIFSWGQKIRDGKVVELLNKIYFSHFKNDSNFKLVRKDWFSVVEPGFKAEYYFAKDDAVKIESVSPENLLQMAEDINRNTNHKIRNIIFYDLDSANLNQYEKDIFKKVLDRFN